MNNTYCNIRIVYLMITFKFFLSQRPARNKLHLGFEDITSDMTEPILGRPNVT